MTQTTSHPAALAERYPDATPVNTVRDEIAHLAVPHTSMRPHPDNPRIGDPDEIAESLWLWGQYKPIVVQDSTGFIVAGNHTWQAAGLLGWDRIAAVRLALDDDTARRLLLADNRYGDIAGYDDAVLAGLLQEMGDLAGTGYDTHDLDALLARMSSDLPDGFKPLNPDDDPDPDDEDEDEDERGRPSGSAVDGGPQAHTGTAVIGRVRCPECRHEFAPTESR